MPARILLLLVSLCFAPPALAQDAPRVAGKIELAEGIARIEARGKPARRPAAGQSVHEGETLITSGQSQKGKELLRWLR